MGEKPLVFHVFLLFYWLRCSFHFFDENLLGLIFVGDIHQFLVAFVLLQKVF